VQNVIELEEGESALKLTTASYRRPSGKNIHRFPDATEEDEWGVIPNEGFEIKYSADELNALMKSQQQREVLSQEAPPEEDFEDTQLNKALEYVRTQLHPQPTQPAQNKDAPPADEDDAKDAAA
jgi:carboxyl-terminal processing protease